MMTKNRDSLELKKHIGAIHSSGAMTLVQRKIANGLLYNAYNELLEKKEHQISIKDLCQLIGYDSNDRKIIKKALVNLLSTVVEWNLIDKNSAIETAEEKVVWNASAVIADASIDGSICTYSYSNKMKQLLYRPEIYGRLNMEVQAKFRSSYGLALYENCIRYQNLDQTPWIIFDIFRKLMGVEENKYVVFRDFKRRVLDTAIAEVNLYSSIIVQPEIKKKARQVIAVRFLISRRAEIKSISSERVVKKYNDELYDKLKIDFGMSEQQILEIREKYGQEYIMEKIKLIEFSESFLKGKIINLAGYLANALENNYQAPRSSKVLVSTTQKPKLTISDYFNETEAKAAYRNYQINQVRENFNHLDELQQKNILHDFEKHIGNSVYIHVYKKEGLKNVLVFEEFLVFVKLKNISELLVNVSSFSIFCEQQKNTKTIN